MDFVKVSVQNRVGEIALNRPEKRNALNAQFVNELKQSFRELEANKECKVIVLKGYGDAFCAGADLGYLQELQQNTFDENLQDSTNLMELFKLIYTLKKVVIAQIEGHAIAGGCGLATVCDLAYSIPEAKYGYTEVKIGFIPAIVKVFLLRKIGEAKSKELLLTGKLIEAEEALQKGLINGIYKRNTIDQEVRKIALNLCESCSPQSLARTKDMIGAVQSMSLEEGLTYAAKQNALSRESDDCKKGIASFLNKEKISW